MEYCFGAVVEHKGNLYQVIQAHRSEPNWQPAYTRALWSQLLQGAEHEYRSGQKFHGVEDHHRLDAGLAQQLSDGENGQSYPPQPGGWGHDEHSDERFNPQVVREGWLNEKKKHRFEIVGAILGSLSLDGGVFAYSRNLAKEATKNMAWGISPSRAKWLQGAYAHTKHYSTGGQHPPVYWILVDKGDPIPHNAIDGGREARHWLYIGRVFYNGGLHIGKVSAHTDCIISFGGKEIKHLDKYEILCGDQNAVNWVNHSPDDGNTDVLVNRQAWKPVEGGREGYGRCQFISQVEHNGNLYPCKALAGSAWANYPLVGKEYYADSFKLLVYAEAIPN